MDVLRRNNVKVTGQGPRTILFAHGFGCDQKMWRFVVPAFEASHRVVLFDYVGCGESETSAWTESRYGSLEGYATDVIEIVEALDLRDVIFVGHSVSSIIGILAAKRRPERFADLILVGPSPRYIDDPPGYVGGFSREDIEGLLEMMDKNFIGWAGFLAPVVMKNDDRPELADELQASFCSTDPRLARKFAEVTFLSDNRDDLADLEVPSLILQCSEDSVAPLEVGEFMRTHLPKSELVQMSATGHCPHMSHPEETIRLIQRRLGT